MFQNLSYNYTLTTESEYFIIKGFESFKFFIKRIGYIILCLYSTAFTASIDPFNRPQYTRLVYCIGFALTLLIFIRLCNHLIKFIQYYNGKIAFKSGRIICTDKKGSIEINTGSLNKPKLNFLGNMILNVEKSSSSLMQISFPLMLLQKKDSEEILTYFEDASPQITVAFRKAYDFFEALFVAFIFAMHIREFIIQNYYIPSGSMENTLQVGDHLLVEKITYGPAIPKMPGMSKEVHLNFLGLRDIRRNDIIIFKPPNEPEKDYIKRCIALPGDELHIKDDSVYLNGKKLEEPFIKGVTNYDYFREHRIEGIVPEGHIVALGDNRENSSDSRAFGYLPIERIKGKALVMYWNTKQIINFDFTRFGLIR
jgi:signal peptidase I